MQTLQSDFIPALTPKIHPSNPLLFARVYDLHHPNADCLYVGGQVVDKDI